MAFIEAQVAPLFRRRDWQRRSVQYLGAVLTPPATRCNTQNLAAAVDGATPCAFQRFLSEAPWDHRQIIGALYATLGPLLDSEQGIWLLEQIAFTKQGDHSIGVSQQASGVHGAPQNYQIGIFLAYASPRAHAFVDMQFYLPPSWAEDGIRRRQAGVPYGVQYQSKADLALTLLRNARTRGQLASQRVTGAGEFRQDVAFRETLDGEGWSYLLEVPGSLPVFTEPVVSRKLPVLSNGIHRRRGPGTFLPCTPYPSKVRELATGIPPQVSGSTCNGSCDKQCRDHSMRRPASLGS